LETVPQHVMSWATHGLGFFVHDQDELVARIFPHFFRQHKFSSFKRQLNLYGFRYMTKGLDTGCYFHPLFRRDRADLVKYVVRVRKNCPEHAAKSNALNNFLKQRKTEGEAFDCPDVPLTTFQRVQKNFKRSVDHQPPSVSSVTAEDIAHQKPKSGGLHQFCRPSAWETDHPAPFSNSVSPASAVSDTDSDMGLPYPPPIPSDYLGPEKSQTILSEPQPQLHGTYIPGYFNSSYDQQKSFPQLQGTPLDVSSAMPITLSSLAKNNSSHQIAVLPASFFDDAVGLLTGSTGSTSCSSAAVDRKAAEAYGYAEVSNLSELIELDFDQLGGGSSMSS